MRIPFGEGGDESLGVVLANDSQFRMELGWEDLIWAARMVKGEGGSSSREHALALLWCQTSRVVWRRNGRGDFPKGTLKVYMKEHSQPINPGWRDDAVEGDTPAEIRKVGLYCTDRHIRTTRCRRGGSECIQRIKTVHCSEEKKRRRISHSTIPWESISEEITNLVVAWARGETNNPVPRAVDFAAVRVTVGERGRTARDGQQGLVSRNFFFIWNSAGQGPEAYDGPGNHFVGTQRAQGGKTPSSQWFENYVRIVGPNSTSSDGNIPAYTPPPLSAGGGGSAQSNYVVPAARRQNEARERRQALTRGRTEANSSAKYPYFIVSGSDPNTDGVVPDRSIIQSPFDRFYNQITDLRSLSTLEMNSIVPVLRIWTTDENNNPVDLNQLIFSETQYENFGETVEFSLGGTPERPIASIDSFVVNVQTPSVGGPTGIITGKLTIVVHNTKRVNKFDPRGKFIHWMLKQGLHMRIRFGTYSNFEGAELPGVKSIEDDFYIAQHEIDILDELSARIVLTVLPAHSKLFNQVLIGESIPANEITSENIENSILAVSESDTSQSQINELRYQLGRFQNEFNRAVRSAGTDAEEGPETERGTRTLSSVLQGTLRNDQIIFSPDGFNQVLVRNYIEALKMIQSNFMTRRFERIAENHSYTHNFRAGLAQMTVINMGPLIWEMAQPEIQKVISLTAETGVRLGQTTGGDTTEGRNRVKIVFGNFNTAAGDWAGKPISTFPVDVEKLMSFFRSERQVGRFADNLNNFIGNIASIISKRDFYTTTRTSGTDGESVPRIEVPDVKYLLYPDPTDESSWIFYLYDKKETIIHISNLLHDLRRDNNENITRDEIKEKCNQYKIPWIELGSETNLVKKLGAKSKADDMIMSHNLYLANNSVAQRNLDGSANITPGVSVNFLTGVSPADAQEVIRATELLMPIHMNMSFFGAVDSVLFGHFYIFFPLKQFSGLYTIYQLDHSVKNGEVTTDYTLQIQITDRNRTD